MFKIPCIFMNRDGDNELGPGVNDIWNKEVSQYMIELQLPCCAIEENSSLSQMYSFQDTKKKCILVY